MLERIKNIYNNIKDIFWAVLTPALLIFVYILRLISQRKQLQEDLAKAEGDKKVTEDLVEKKEAEAHAETSEEAYIKLRDEFNSNKPDGSST